MREAAVPSVEKIVIDRRFSENGGALERAGDARACDEMRAHAADILSEHFDPSGRRLGDPAEDVEERRFAGAVWADDTEDVASLDCEADAFQRVHPAIVLLNFSRANRDCTIVSVVRERRLHGGLLSLCRRGRQRSCAGHPARRP